MARVKKKHHIISTIILIAAFAVLGFSLFKIGSEKLEYKKGRDEYNKIRAEAMDKDDPDSGINWKKLKKINPDIVGWIRFKEPKIINYPIVQGEDNSIYLSKSFGENFHKFGCIFINCDNKKNFSDQNTIIYGHNLDDGSMFASLKQYEDKAFWRKHKEFQIYTPDDVRHNYKIFAVGTYPATSGPATKFKFRNKKEFRDFLDEVRKYQLYETHVGIYSDDKIVTLYTCTNVREADRRLVFGVWVGDGKDHHF